MNVPAPHRSPVRTGPTTVDDALLTDLAHRFGTPAYVYDLAAVRHAATALVADLPVGSDLLYSVKANPHPRVVAELVSLGLACEISSTGELRAALDAGCAPDRLLYTGPGKTPGELRTAVESGVTFFSVESPGDRDRLAEACAATGRNADYLVRLHGPRGSRRGGLRMTGRPSAFGTDVTAVDELSQMFRPTGRIRPVGTHTFSATNLVTPDALLEELQQAITVTAHAANRAGFTPQTVDLGGGFPAPFASPGPLPRHPLLASGLTVTLDQHVPGWREGRPRLLFESGRYLTATAGTLLTTVIDVKRSGGRTFVVVDAGVNALGGMSGLGRLRAPAAQLRPLGPAGTTPAPVEPATDEAVTVVGPLCTPLDVLSTSAALNGVQSGQLLAVPNTGAYGLTASLLGFLSHPAPTEIVLDDGHLVSARRLEMCPRETSFDV
ncbi:type III PLP-dependent enzyme [Streptomyces sp. TG1A-8]|uniref:type III PLP-dependent enzyme n=1 Tax=Streptomyces sp. TG1A-8 TaxID=3051385 RepID=UPI00265BFF1C|nr:type III PLP-dependent enzyme [Streptomyces sp. TG1A-8]MDO0925024.1 type III PLP-dependent enzyme [Streptomyces sp. TG1A-8]